MGASRDEIEAREILRESATLVRSQGLRDIWRFSSGEILSIPRNEGSPKRARGAFWRNVKAEVRRKAKGAGGRFPEQAEHCRELARQMRARGPA